MSVPSGGTRTVAREPRSGKYHRSSKTFKAQPQCLEAGTEPEHGMGLHHFNQPLMRSTIAFVDIP